MVPSLALGTGEVTLIELTAAYTAFAQSRDHVTAATVHAGRDADGVPLFFKEEQHTRAISERPPT